MIDGHPSAEFANLRVGSPFLVIKFRCVCALQIFCCYQLFNLQAFELCRRPSKFDAMFFNSRTLLGVVVMM
jgi:hypothetical protein